MVPFHTAASLMVFGVLLPSLTTMAADEKAFVILPGAAPRYSGNRGREADVTELFATGDQTRGALVWFRQTIAPNSGPPGHIHRITDEFFYVVRGDFSVKLGDRIVH